MEMENVLARVRKTFNTTFETDPELITLDTAPGDIAAWDSMGHVTLASGLEREFDVSLDVDDLMAMENVREILTVLKVKLGKK
jgi:acyl carrier protein